MEYIQADIWVRFQRMLGNVVHFVCADDAHGAPIMLKARSRGRLPPGTGSQRVTADRPRYLEGLSHRLRSLVFDGTRRRTRRCPRTSTGRLKAAGLIYVKAIEQFYDPVKAMFLADRYNQGRMPQLPRPKTSTPTPVKSAASSIRPTDLIDPYSTLSGREAPHEKRPSTIFFRLSDPKCVEFLGGWLATPERLQPQVINKAREWLSGKGDEALGDWDISRDAPYFGIPIPDAPGKYFYVWLDAPDRVSRITAELLRYRGRARRARGENRTFAEFLAASRHGTAALHRQGHHLLPHTVSGRPC